MTLRIISREPSNQMHDVEIWVVHSAIAEVTFRVSVAGPGAPLPAGTRLNVVFGTDGDLTGGTNISVARGNTHGGEPPLFVVNVGYPREAGPLGWAVNRMRDLIPFPRPDLDPIFSRMLPGVPKTGGGEAFLAFMTAELKPLIESEYPVSAGPAGLLGVSAGGFFVLYALAKAQQHFNRVLCVSPALLYGREELAAVLAASTANPTPSEARLFTCAGELESREHWRAIVAASPEPMRSHWIELSERVGWPDLRQDALDAGTLFGRRKGLQVKSQVLPHEHHGSVYGAALSQGLRWLYDAGTLKITG